MGCRLPKDKINGNTVSICRWVCHRDSLVPHTCYPRCFHPCPLIYFSVLSALSPQVAMLICAGFLIAWIPYAVVSVWSAFGRPDSIPIQLSVVPTLLAKSAAMYNPIIYQVIDSRFACCQNAGLKATKKKSLEDFR